MSSIADRYGFRDYRTVWDDPSNAELKQKRVNPDVLFAGDRVTIPDKEQRVEDAETTRRHRYVARSTRTFLRLRIDTPHALDFELSVDGGAPMTGTVDGEEPIVKPIDPAAQRAELRLWRRAADEEKTRENARVIPIELGALDPIEEVAGVQGRLLNLAFFDGPIDGKMGPRTSEAISSTATGSALFILMYSTSMRSHIVMIPVRAPKPSYSPSATTSACTAKLSPPMWDSGCAWRSCRR